MKRDLKKEELYISGLLGPRSLRGLMEQTGAGLESILFSISYKLDKLEETIERAKRRLAVMNGPALVLHGPFLDLNAMSFDSRIREVTEMRFAQAWRAAEALGAGKVIYHSGFVPSTCYAEGWAKRMAEFWERFLDGREGIEVLVENVFDPEPGPLLELAERIEHPYFGLCLDIGHAHCFGTPPVRLWAETLGGHIRHVHLHDNDGSADQHLALGEGNIPMAEVLPLLAAHAPGWTIECAQEEEVLRSADVLRTILVENSLSMAEGETI